jgi:nucleoside-diphosphate-sugar epimerase
MRILVTGASGFIGRHAASELARQGHELIAVARKPLGDLPDVDWRECDLLVPDAAARLVGDAHPDAVLHLAWATEHGRFWTDPANLLWLARSLDLAHAAQQAGVARLVMAGTCFEYDFEDGSDCDEHLTALRQHTLYDTMKDACRRAVAAYADSTDLSFAWARLFHLYGPHESPGRLVSSIARALAAGEPAPTSRGLVWRDFMDARDAGAALAALTTSDVTGPVNVATGEAVQIATVARMLGDMAGCPDLVQFGALPDRAGDPPRIVARVARLRDEVGFVPAHTLREGLSDALDWWRGQAKAGS